MIKMTNDDGSDFIHHYMSKPELPSVTKRNNMLGWLFWFVIILFVLILGTSANAQASMTFTDYKVFDTVKGQTSFEKKLKTFVLIDYTAKKIVIDNDTLLRFLDMISFSSSGEDVFFSAKDKDNRMYKLSALVTSTHYIFVEALEQNIKTYRVLKN